MHSRPLVIGIILFSHSALVQAQDREPVVLTEQVQRAEQVAEELRAEK